MCGICGVYWGVNERKKYCVENMIGALHHRGPDGTGTYFGSGISLGHTRLAIVDLNSGQQPMFNEDNTIVIVYNGEVYNHRVLRTQLQNLGHTFRTSHCDTEVIIHGYEQWGERVLDRLNGMFAFAIWNEKKRELFLARDRFGIKPLYYHLGNGFFMFASEIKAMLSSGLIEKKPSYEGIAEYFSFQNIWREQTMFEGILQLEQGHFIRFSQNNFEKRRYWDIKFNRHSRMGIDKAAKEHRDLLTTAVKLQIQADVPVMSYLSGGIDSTAITYAAKRLSNDVRAYSCIFNLDKVEEDSILDEREYSALAASELGIEHNILELTPFSIINSIGKCVEALEDLRMGMSYNVFLIAKRVAEDAKVVLSGTGGDEFHGGYIGRYNSVAPGYVSPTGLIKRMLSFFRNNNLDKKDEQIRLYKDILNFPVKIEKREEILTREFIENSNGYDPEQVMNDMLQQCPSKNIYDTIMYVDVKTYLAGLLVLEDKLSMAHSLETRVPLLDNDLVEFTLQLPWDYMINKDHGKILFRESVKPWVPDKIFNKPKMGFGPPDASWYRNFLRDWIKDLLSEDTIKKRGIINPGFVSTSLEEHFSRKKNNAYIIWSLICFETWCRRFDMFN